MAHAIFKARDIANKGVVAVETYVRFCYNYVLKVSPHHRSSLHDVAIFVGIPMAVTDRVYLDMGSSRLLTLITKFINTRTLYRS